jgi:hypothetical protein
MEKEQMAEYYLDYSKYKEPNTEKETEEIKKSF